MGQFVMASMAGNSYLCILLLSVLFPSHGLPQYYQEYEGQAVQQVYPQYDLYYQQDQPQQYYGQPQPHYQNANQNCPGIIWEAVQPYYGGSQVQPNSGGIQYPFPGPSPYNARGGCRGCGPVCAGHCGCPEMPYVRHYLRTSEYRRQDWIHPSI